MFGLNRHHHHTTIYYFSFFLGTESESLSQHAQTTTATTAATTSNGLNKANNNINNHHHHHHEEQLKQQQQQKPFGLNGYAKTIINSAVNYVQKGGSDTQNNNDVGGYVDSTTTTTTDLETPAMLKKVNNLKLQPPSPAYDRYPKVGTMKVYPITTPDRDEPKLDNTQIIQVIQSSCSQLMTVRKMLTLIFLRIISGNSIVVATIRLLTCNYNVRNMVFSCFCCLLSF